MDEISTTIESIVRERFAGVPSVIIHSVNVAKDTDYDDEEVLRVTIVFEHKGVLDPRETAAMVGRIRNALLAHNEERFPLVAFVSKSDAKRSGAEAA